MRHSHLRGIGTPSEAARSITFAPLYTGYRLETCGGTELASRKST